MAFPTTPILDDFNTGAGQLLTARTGWSPNIFFTGEPSLTTDAAPTYATTQTAAFGSNYWATSFTDCEIYITRGTVAAVADMYLYTRITNPNSTTPSGYLLQFTDSSSTWQIRTITAGVTATLTSGTQAVIAGDQLGLISVGNTHTAWFNGVSLGSVTDSTFPRAGVLATELGANGRYDSFGGGATNAFGPQFPRHIGPASVGFGKATV